MTNMELISIIIPLYNKSKLISRCVESLLSQSYKRTEIIIVDDGSTDDGGILCDRLYGNLDNIHIIHQENRGISEARNSGIKVAKGEWIAFVDADDYVDKDYLLDMYNAASEKGAQIVVSDFVEVYSNGKIRKNRAELQEIDNNIDFLSRLWNSADTNVACIVVWNKLYHAKEIQHIKFCGRIHEDERFFNELYRNDLKMCFVDKQLYYYCFYTESLIHKDMSPQKYAILEIMQNRIEMLKKHGLEKLVIKAQTIYIELCINLVLNIPINAKERYKYKTICWKLLFATFKKNDLKTNMRYFIFLVSTRCYKYITKKR